MLTFLQILFLQIFQLMVVESIYDPRLQTIISLLSRKWWFLKIISIIFLHLLSFCVKMSVNLQTLFMINFHLKVLANLWNNLFLNNLWLTYSWFTSFRCIIQRSTIFKDYTVFRVIVKYWLCFLCCIVCPWRFFILHNTS